MQLNTEYTGAGRVIIIGATGMIGRVLHKHVADASLSVVGTYCRRPLKNEDRFDILQDDLLTLVPCLDCSDTVVLLAAETNVNEALHHPERSTELNVNAGLRLAQRAFSRGAGVVFVSTELVFDGRTGGYSEADAPNPTTVYGKQKVAMENFLMASKGRWTIVRTGANIGYTKGDNCLVAKTYETLLQPNARMAQDNVFTITDVEDTAAGILHLIRQRATGVFHVVANPPVSRIELAEAIIKASRYRGKMSYVPVHMKDLFFTEERPARSWMSNTRVRESLGMRFRPLQDSVQKKVRLLDDWLNPVSGDN